MPIRQRRSARLATTIWLVTMTLCVVSVVLILATLWVEVPDSWGFRGASVLAGATFGSVGAVVARRRPDNGIGWLFCAIGILFAIEGLVVEYTIAGALAVPGRLPWVTGIGWILTWIWVIPAGLALIYLPLLFPTGRLVSRRWRPVAWLGVVSLAASAAIVAVAPGPIVQATYLDNPLGLRVISLADFSQSVVPIAFVGLGAAILLAVVSMVRRFTAATGEARLQIKWFAFAVAVAGTLNVVYDAAFVVATPAAIVKALEILVIVGLLSLPVTAGLAILRYRLYEIDRIISRTVSYAAVTALLAFVFVGAILLFQAILSPLLDANAVGVAASTLVVAALFQPLRRRVQRIVDRRFDRARYDADRILSAFSARLRDDVDLTSLDAEIGTVVRQTLAPASLRLWLHPKDSGE